MDLVTDVQCGTEPWVRDRGWTLAPGYMSSVSRVRSLCGPAIVGPHGI